MHSLCLILFVCLFVRKITQQSAQPPQKKKNSSLVLHFVVARLLSIAFAVGLILTQIIVILITCATNEIRLRYANLHVFYLILRDY